jgi:hypothetical protein
VASGRLVAGRLRIEACRPACDLDGSGLARERALAALGRFLAAAGEAVVGCDFPFGLPASLAGPRHWEAFLGGFAGRFEGPEAFRAWCRERAGGEERRRATDREAKTPFSPYNHRLFRQTYPGLASLLAPLVAAGEVCVLPMQEPSPRRPWLVEVCPASTLRQLGLRRPYKGRGSERRRARAAILDALEARERVDLADASLRARLIADPGGDALDAVVAALAARRVLADPSVLAPASGAYAVEGRVYV